MNKPIAWMANGAAQTDWDFVPVTKNKRYESDIPLYTHPADHEKTFNEMVELYEKQLDKKADRIAELEKDLALKTRDRDVFKNFTLAYEERIAELEKDLAKYDELAIDDLKGRGIVWCACGDAITPDSGAVCGVCASFRSAKNLTMTFEEMYPIAEKHLGHAIGLYNWKIFGDAILKKASEK